MKKIYSLALGISLLSASCWAMPQEMDGTTVETNKEAEKQTLKKSIKNLESQLSEMEKFDTFEELFFGLLPSKRVPIFDYDDFDKARSILSNSTNRFEAVKKYLTGPEFEQKLQDFINNFENYLDVLKVSEDMAFQDPANKNRFTEKLQKELTPEAVEKTISSDVENLLTPVTQATEAYPTSKDYPDWETEAVQNSIIQKGYMGIPGYANDHDRANMPIVIKALQELYARLHNGTTFSNIKQLVSNAEIKKEILESHIKNSISRLKKELNNLNK